MMIHWEGEQEEIWAKDWDISSFLRRFPHMESVVVPMREMLPEGHSRHLVDMIVKEHRLGEPTCRDVRWHFDGDFHGNNAYVLWAKGVNRTEFPLEIPPLDPPADRESQNRYLEGLGLVGVEVPEMEAVGYDSRVPHRGVLCRVPGKRMFLRVMGTDTIRAKNFVRRDS
jgi:hypothetical protein